ncbi:MAG: cation:dicarboxylate symporter family transporter [Bacteroidales bacterium]
MFFTAFILAIATLYFFKTKRYSFSKRVFAGMGIGLILGIATQLFMPDTLTPVALEWTEIIGGGYVRLLQMIVVPLIFISILSAILKLDPSDKSIGRSSMMIIAILIGTAIIAALVGILTANAFNLSMGGLTQGSQELTQAALLEQRSGQLNSSSFAERILAFIPTNIFSDLSGSRSTSMIAIVIFSGLLGISSRGLLRRKEEIFVRFKNGVLVIHDVILELVKFILRLTPYGVLALTFKIAATSQVHEIMQLGNFILASYVALISMFLIHLALIALSGTNPLSFLKKVIPVLVFAFTSRSSAASIPMNIRTQIDKLNINEGIANLAATLGASIGQNGCAAIYPAMLAVMIAPGVGINPTDPHFIIELVAVVAISSFGVAGVGGGATFAALMVLSNMNLPVALVGLLISVEPLIDMGRTTLNVNGSIVAGLITNRFYDKPNKISE